jgi:hypothetical protein
MDLKQIRRNKNEVIKFRALHVAFINYYGVDERSNMLRTYLPSIDAIINHLSIISPCVEDPYHYTRMFISVARYDVNLADIIQLLCEIRKNCWELLNHYTIGVSFDYHLTGLIELKRHVVMEQLNGFNTSSVNNSIKTINTDSHVESNTEIKVPSNIASGDAERSIVEHNGENFQIKKKPIIVKNNDNYYLNVARVPQLKDARKIKDLDWNDKIKKFTNQNEVEDYEFISSSPYKGNNVGKYYLYKFGEPPKPEYFLRSNNEVFIRDINGYLVESFIDENNGKVKMYWQWSN